MTKLSLVPEISAYKGIDFINLIKLILMMHLRKSNKIFIYLLFFLLEH